MKQATDFSQLVVEGASFDADEMSEMIGRVYQKIRIEPLLGFEPIRLSAAHGSLPGVRLGRMEIGSGMRALQLDPDDAVGFAVPFMGHMETRGRQGDFGAAAGAAIAFDLSVCEVVRCSPNHGNYSVGIDRALIARRLAYLTGRPAREEIVFAPETDARSNRGVALTRLLACVTDPTFGLVLRSSPFTAAHIPALMIDFLLENWPHTYSAEFRREPPSIAPRAVKAAIDFLEAHPMTAASAEELARLCGVSLRALQYGFRRFAGASITEYQRRVRLDRARLDLMASPDPVQAVALRWGFTNPGRFSRHFKATFGDLPVQAQTRLIRAPPDWFGSLARALSRTGRSSAEPDPDPAGRAARRPDLRADRHERPTRPFLRRVSDHLLLRSRRPGKDRATERRPNGTRRIDGLTPLPRPAASRPLPRQVLRAPALRR